MPSRRSTIGILISVLLFIAGLLGVVLSVVYLRKAASHQPYNYGLVVDVGSSATDIYLYRWPNTFQDQGVTNISQVFHEHCHKNGTHFSVASYASEPKVAVELITECIHKVLSGDLNIQPSTNRITAFLGSTAAMRELCLVEPVQCRNLIEALRAGLLNLHFQLFDDGVRILTGLEEGIFGWITVNFLAKTFEQEVQPLGALDLGSASTQITFSVENHFCQLGLPDMAPLQIYGKAHCIYSHSYACYGYAEAERTVGRMLILANRGRHNITNPCLPSDVRVLLTYRQLTSQFCRDYVLKEEDHRENYAFVGSGDLQECVVLIKILFNRSWCPYRTCSFNQIFQPSIRDTKLQAFSYFRSLMGILKLPSTSTLMDFRSSMNSECFLQPIMKDWTEYEARKCQHTVFFYTLLVYGIGLGSTGAVFVHEVGSAAVSWSLGYMIKSMKMLPVDEPKRSANAPEFLALLVVSVCVASAGCTLVLLFVVRILEKRHHKEHQVSILLLANT